MLGRVVNFLIRLVKSQYYRLIFKEFGYRSTIGSVLKLEYPVHIEIEEDVSIGELAWLASNPILNSNPVLRIGKGCLVGNFSHIYSTFSINIQENVLIADKVYISDNLHHFTDVTTPILKQGIKQLKGITIGSGSWIGEGVSIIGASVGKNSIVGANAVVTKDIPDYCVAVGIPADIIKRYCHERESWLKTNADGSFIDKF